MLVSLWPIADDPTAALMEAFYREVLAGARRDEALARAMRHMAETPGLDHPSLWAGFQLLGRAD